MARLVWNQTGERFYETGVDRGVLYRSLFDAGVPWNGLISVSEDVSGGAVNNYYLDGVKYLDFVASEDFSATLEAFSAPPEFSGCDGSKVLSPGLFATQQPRRTFHLSYRTKIGNDLDGLNYGYKLHIVYNATAAPSSQSSRTVGNQVSPETRQWNIHTVPPPATNYKPTAHFVIDSTLVEPQRMALLEDRLYGTPSEPPKLPSASEVIALLA